MKQLYHSYEEMVLFFKNLAKQYPSNVRVESIGQTWEKRDIILVTLSADMQEADNRPALFFTGTIHAREWIGLELAIGLSKYVTNHYEYDPTLESILSRATLYMVPCANPDGFEFSRKHFGFWRKNRRVNADGTFGVDLNRNFSIGWNASKNTTSNIYGGPEPFSEPETLSIKNFVDAHENITIALDYHSQGNVFFPAHDFRHEDTIDTTDMNVLCANMARMIKKVSDRDYGVDQGKPPAKLIGGSGREYYYSRGIISSVVEVGTRNISDYLDDMQEHIKEHIPALLKALTEVPNYQKDSLPRVPHFSIDIITDSTVKMVWEYESSEDLYFELYRSNYDKSFCLTSNLIAKTHSLEFIDTNLNSATDYFYYIRAVSKSKKLKSPFAPRVQIKTLPAHDEFYRIYHPIASRTGYVSSKSTKNSEHFGSNSLFVGVNENKGVSYAMLSFPLKSIPNDIEIVGAKFMLYAMNRVGATIEKYGEWSVSMVDQIEDITSFKSVEECVSSCAIGKAFGSHRLSQGKWHEWEFNSFNLATLSEHLSHDEVIFKVEGPKSLPIGRASQMMQYDIGYGAFGFGLAFRPKLEILYKRKPKVLELSPKTVHTLKVDEISDGLSCGYDSSGKKVYTLMDFDLSELGEYDNTIITNAYIKLQSTTTYIKDDIRFHIEMIDKNKEFDYQAMQNRDTIESIGYDVSSNELSKKDEQLFVFDTHGLMAVNNILRNSEQDASFIMRPTSAKKVVKNKIVSWSTSQESLPKLVLEYIHKRRSALDKIEHFSYTTDGSELKLTWKNPNDEEFVGVWVVKNSFREPKSPFDGQKVYAGRDEYTFDSFGSLDRSKYFAIFTYDNVPNFSQPTIIHYEQ